LLVITGSRYNRYRYNHIRAPTRPDFSTESTRYIRLLVITGLVIYDFYCIVVFISLFLVENSKPLCLRFYVFKRGNEDSGFFFLSMLRSHYCLKYTNSMILLDVNVPFHLKNGA